jgi:hypothetical protein
MASSAILSRPPREKGPVGPGASPAAVSRASRGAGVVYDASAVSRILGLLCECGDPALEAPSGEIVVYYGGWDLRTLRACPAGQQHMWQRQGRCEECGTAAQTGYYRLPLPGSGRNARDGKAGHPRTDEESHRPALVAVAATALLVHLAEDGAAVLQGDACRSAEPLLIVGRTGLWVFGGRVYVCGYWGDRRDSHVCLLRKGLCHVP